MVVWGIVFYVFGGADSEYRIILSLWCNFDLILIYSKHSEQKDWSSILKRLKYLNSRIIVQIQWLHKYKNRYQILWDEARIWIRQIWGMPQKDPLSKLSKGSRVWYRILHFRIRWVQIWGHFLDSTSILVYFLKLSRVFEWFHLEIDHRWEV